jgi:hypothetical protein
VPNVFVAMPRKAAIAIKKALRAAAVSGKAFVVPLQGIICILLDYVGEDRIPTVLSRVILASKNI